MECYDSSKQSICMSQYLPYSGFKWLNQKEIDRFNVESIGENSSIGYILEADLEYSSELNDVPNDYPLAPEKLEVSQNVLQNIANEYGIKIGGVNNLVPNLGNESEYVVHYRDLQLYLSLGMKLTKVHRIFKFKQSDWLRNTLILMHTKGKIQLMFSKKIILN